MWAWVLGVALGAEWVVGTDAPDLQATVDLAHSGDVVVVGPGTWGGPVRVERAITLRGSPDGSIRSSGQGHTVVVAGPNVTIEGLRVEGSGGNLDASDSCVWFAPEATGSSITGSQLSDCLFGIYIHETSAVRIEGNTVTGLPGVRDADKGNGIHLFDASHLRVAGNTVRDARDGIYVSATENSTILDNDIADLRFGIHYMYSYDNTVAGNRLVDCTAGMALMMSRYLEVHHNVATGHTRQGMLFRDLQECDIHHNTASGNAEGFFFYSSLDNDVHHNVLSGNQVGARIWAGTERNRVWANAFIANRQALFYVSATDQEWGTEEDGGNYWSDHLSWDQDGDGFADQAYRADTTVATLLHRFPASVLLLNSPAMEFLRVLQRKLPALRAPAVVDPRPLIRPPEAS